MIELLALPGWQAPPRSLDDWVAGLTEAGGRVVVAREEAGETWLEMGHLRLRGYAVIEGDRVEAINFELADPDPAPASRVVEAAARALGWEVHPDEPDDDSDAEDDD
jgi:hypothetical protein